MSPRFRLLLLSIGLTLAPMRVASADEKIAPPAKDPPERVDAWGDPLPPGVVCRLGTGRLCQPRAYFLALSLDGKAVAAVDVLGGLRLWEVRAGKELWRFQGPPFGSWNPTSTPAAFSPDGKLIALGAADKTVRVLDAATGRERYKFADLAANMDQLVFSPSGRRLAAGGASVVGQAESGRIWDLDQGKTLVSFGKFDWASGLAYSADGKSLLAVGMNFKGGVKNILWRWDAETGKELARLSLPADLAEQGAALSPDGGLLAVLTMDVKPNPADEQMCDGKTIRLIDATTGKELRRVEGRIDMDFPFVRFSADGRTLTATSADGSVLTWEAATGKVLHDFKALSGEVQRVALSRDGRLAALGGRSDDGIHLWDVEKEKELHAFAGHRAGPLLVAFSHDGKTVFTTNRDPSNRSIVSEWADWSLRQWDPVSGKELRVTRPNLKALVRWTAFSPDGRLLAVVTHDGVLRLWDADDAKLLREWKVPTLMPDDPGGKHAPITIPYEAIFHPTFSADGKTLWAAGKEEIHRWDVGAGKELPVLKTPGYRYWLRCRPAPDGRTFLLAASGGKRTRLDLLDADAGKVVRPLGEVDMMGPDFVFSPDGKTLAATTTAGAALRETATGSDRGGLEGPAEDKISSPPFFPADKRALAFSPDGRLLAVSGKDLIRLVDLPSGRDIGRVDSPGWAESLAFSPDGQRLACGYDNTALICDVAALTAGKLPAPARRTAAELDAYWDDLTSCDGGRAYRAVGGLALSGAEGAAFLKRRLKTDATPIDPGLDRLIKGLDDDDFEAREKATAALEALGPKARAALRRALETTKSDEVRTRAGRLLQKLDKSDEPSPSAALIAQRAVEALERSRSPEARDVLKELADGSPDAEPARAAQAALERLGRAP